MYLAVTDVSGDETTFGNVAIQFLMPGTLITNTTLSILIAGRLVHAHRILSSARAPNSNDGGYTGPYWAALAICVESSAIVWVAALLSYIVLFLPSNDCGGPNSYQPVVIMPQLCVGNVLYLS